MGTFFPSHELRFLGAQRFHGCGFFLQLLLQTPQFQFRPSGDRNALLIQMVEPSIDIPFELFQFDFLLLQRLLDLSAPLCLLLHRVFVGLDFAHVLIPVAHTVIGQPAE